MKKLIQKSRILQLLLITVLSLQSHQSVTVSLHPKNKTANYGEFVTFTCRFHFIDYTPHILEIYFGSSSRHIASLTHFNLLDPNEYFVKITNFTNETVGTAGILINKKTIQVIEFFRCKLIHGRASVFSYPAYIISILYPECAPSSYYRPSLTLYPTPSRTYLLTSATSSAMATLEPCTGNELKTQAAINSSTNSITVGTCSALVVLMLFALILTCACVCIQNNRRFLVAKLKRNSLAANQVTRSMVRNPIYDGPVYESVETHFDSLSTQVTVATGIPAKSSCSKYPQSASIINTADKYRYISQPGMTDNCTVEPITNQHTGQHKGENVIGTLSVVEHNDNMIQQNKEDAYTEMKPTGNCSYSSLSGVYGEVAKLNPESLLDRDSS